MKTNVLVPMAGLGSRFLKEGFTVPKQLINIKDKQLIDISLDCLDTTDCNLIFIIRDEHVYNFRMDEILRMKFGDDIKVIVLDDQAYWVSNNTFYVAEAINGEIQLHTARPINTNGLSKKDLNKMLFILDSLKNGSKNDSSSTGNE